MAAAIELTMQDISGPDGKAAWRAALIAAPAPKPLEIRRNDDGSIDEIVGSGSIHIEQMTERDWFIEIIEAGGVEHRFWLGAKRAHVDVTHTETTPPDRAREQEPSPAREGASK